MNSPERSFGEFLILDIADILFWVQQILIFRMATDIFTHKPAQRPDLKMILPGIVHAGLDQFATQASSSDGRWDAGMREDDDVTFEHVIEHSHMPIECEFEAVFFLIVDDFSVFGFHR